MSNFKVAFAFIVGAAVGGFGAWCYLTKKYVKESEEDIQSVSDAYRNYQKVLEDKITKLEERLKEKDDCESSENVGKVEEKEEDVVASMRAANNTRYHDAVPMEKYHDYELDELDEEIDMNINEDARKVAKIARDSGYVPADDETYVISPDEFGEENRYSWVSYIYYADGILADDNGVIVDNVEEIVGDALDHFGEYEDDTVFCRNDAKRCDYEILKDLRCYSEVRKNLPPNM